MSFENRLILYIDILGFSNFFRQSSEAELEDFLKWYRDFFNKIILIFLTEK